MFSPPSWLSNAVVYEVNVRQFSVEGTFQAFEEHLPRLAELGVDVLWLMPIQPIGKVNRKGTLGSPYAPSDYLSVNPEFGTLEDLKHLVAQAHSLGMKVILDWVANHTAWDHPWTKEHPDWYLHDDNGVLNSCVYDNGEFLEQWTDVIGLDYRQKPLWQAMQQAMRFWVEQADVDGFRCDVAFALPIGFWIEARMDLERFKPMFMLAEAEEPWLHRAFDVSYDMLLYRLFAAVARREKHAEDVGKYLAKSRAEFPPLALRMLYTANHDTNCWLASDAELYGNRLKVFATLTMTLPGMPMILCGQESGLNRRIPFFEKDAIEWGSFDLSDFYKSIVQLKKQHPAFDASSAFEVVPARDPDVLAFQRSCETETATIIANLSDKRKTVRGIAVEPWDYVLRFS